MIEITIKTLKNTVTKISVDENQSISSQLDLFRDAANFPSEPYLKLIYKGKILDQDQTLANYSVLSEDAIVVMKSNPPKPISEPTPVSQQSSQNLQSVETSEPVSNVPPVNSNVPPVNSNVPPVNSNIPPLDSIWTTPPPTDTVPTYSVEQAHIVLPLIISYIMQNPSLQLLMITNPNILGEVMLTQNFRNIVRQLLTQSTNSINSLRNGTPLNVYIGVEGGQTSNSQTGNTFPSTGNGLSQTNGTNESQISMEQLQQAMNVLGMDPSMMQYEDGEYEDEYSDDNHEGHNHDHSHEHSHQNTSQSSGISTQDQQNISELMAITGSQFAVAKQAYESSGRNMDIAASLLMQIMFN